MSVNGEGKAVVHVCVCGKDKNSNIVVKKKSNKRQQGVRRKL